MYGSVAAAIAFYALRLSAVPELWLIPLKGAGCALLALYALFQGDGRESRWLAAMMAIARRSVLVADISEL